MGKYEPLIDFLKSRTKSEVPMTFDEIERIIGRKLPPSATRYRAWWSNNPMNSVLTKAWIEAGWRTEQVDMGSRKLVFRRVVDQHVHDRGKRPSIFGGLKGLVKVMPGVDLTEPAGEVWAAQEGKLDD